MAEDEYYEGMWDCTFCSTANTGSVMQCSGCGAQRPDDVKFYLPDGAKKLTSQAELNDAKSGPDWLCGYCNSSNKAGTKSCGQCGAPAEEGSQRKVGEVKPPAPKKPADDSNVKAPTGGGAPANPMVLIGIIAVLLFCCILAIILGRPKTAAMAVSELRWEARVHWQKESWVDEFSEAKPPFANDIQKIRQETRTIEKTVTEKVEKTKTIDLGNGKFKKEKYFEDVQSKKKVPTPGWAFERRKWVDQDPRVTRGPPSDAPKFPEVRFSGGERESRREVAFVVEFKNPKSNDVCTYEGIQGTSPKDKDDLAPRTIDELKAFKVGDSYEVKYTGSKALSIKKL